MAMLRKQAEGESNLDYAQAVSQVADEFLWSKLAEGTVAEKLGDTVGAYMALSGTLLPDIIAAQIMSFTLGLAIGQGAITVEGHTFPDFTKEG